MISTRNQINSVSKLRALQPSLFFFFFLLLQQPINKTKQKQSQSKTKAKTKNKQNKQQKKQKQTNKKNKQTKNKTKNTHKGYPVGAAQGPCCASQLCRLGSGSSTSHRRSKSTR
jgi:hypothetical protein